MVEQVRDIEVSRAIDHQTVWIPELSLPGGLAIACAPVGATRNGRPVQPSRWVQAIVDTAALEVPVPPPARRPRVVDPLAPLKAWRDAVARASGQLPTAVCNDRVLRSLLAQPPTDARDLAHRLGITETAAARLRPLPV